MTKWGQQEGEYPPALLADWLAHNWGRMLLAVRVRVTPRL